MVQPSIPFTSIAVSCILLGLSHFDKLPNFPGVLIASVSFTVATAFAYWISVNGICRCPKSCQEGNISKISKETKTSVFKSWMEKLKSLWCHCHINDSEKDTLVEVEGRIGHKPSKISNETKPKCCTDQHDMNWVEKIKSYFTFWKKTNVIQKFSLILNCMYKIIFHN